MNAFFNEFATNSSLFDVICTYLGTINIYFIDTFTLFRDSTKNKELLSIFDNLSESLYFNEFQLTLLKTFLIILFCNLIFIFIAWKIYGKRICDRFMKPATSKAIEELKASVSKLKLPKEHTPRI